VCLNQLVCFADQCNASRFDVADHTETATPALSWAVARAAVAFGSDYLQSALPREGVAIPKSPVPPSGNPSAVRHLIWPIYGTFRRPPPQQRIWSELAQRMTIKRRGRRQAASGKNAAAGQNGGQTRSEIIAITDVAQWNAAEIKA